MNSKRLISKLMAMLLIILILILSLRRHADAEENYVFERMWPTLQQPWYFYFVFDIAIDPNNNIYVVDSHNSRIQKFNPDGEFITKWGSNGPENGQFSNPSGIAIDKNENI